MPDPYRTTSAVAVERAPCAFCGAETEIRLADTPVCAIHAMDPNDAQVARAALAIVDAAVTVAVADAITSRR